jgi:hypothetical protein
VQAAKLGGHDVVILDTAGRTHIDEPLMAEMAEIKKRANPHEILLVADALTGQDAVNLANNFDERVGISGLVLTRMDGDGRGGAALSMRAVTGKPIKLIGTGEKMDALEEFHPRASPTASSAWATSSRWSRRRPRISTPKRPEAMAARMKKGKFDLNDLADQLGQMQKLGGMGGIMGMMPGMGKMKDQMSAAGMDDKTFARQLAIIGSMTKAERANPDILKHSRKKRIAAGSGTDAAADQQASQDAPADGRHDESHGRQGQGRRHDACGHGRPGPKDGPARRHGWHGRHAGSVEDGPEAARGAAEAGGSRRPRQGRPSWRNARGVARTGWAEAARSWRRRPSRPAEEEVRAAHEHQ